MLIALKEWCEKNDAINRSIDKLWECFKEYKEEYYEEFNTIFKTGKDDINLYLNNISYEVLLPNYDNEVISVTIDIFVNDIDVGWFKQQYCLDGSTFDEFFVIDEVR